VKLFFCDDDWASLSAGGGKFIRCSVTKAEAQDLKRESAEELLFFCDDSWARSLSRCSAADIGKPKLLKMPIKVRLFFATTLCPSSDESLPAFGTIYPPAGGSQEEELSKQKALRVFLLLRSFFICTQFARRSQNHSIYCYLLQAVSLIFFRFINITEDSPFVTIIFPY